jgi:hypothetical protein
VKNAKVEACRFAAVGLSALGLAACVVPATSSLETEPSDEPPTSREEPVGIDPSWDDEAAGDGCAVDELLAPHAYGAKAKTLLTGAPLDAAELAKLEADPTALAAMIDGWLDTPEGRDVLERFFMTAFQQTGGNRDSLFHLLGQRPTGTGKFTAPASATADVLLNENLAESFARTAAWMVLEGKSLRDVMTTDTYLMTTAQMVFTAYLDDDVVGDDGNHTIRTTANRFPTIKLVRNAADAPPLEQALDPSSNAFATFWHAGLADLPASCGVKATEALDTTAPIGSLFRLAPGISPSYYVFSHLVLGRQQRVRRTDGAAGCQTTAVNQRPLLERSDFSDFRPVRIRRPDEGEATTRFFRVDALRGADELVLHTEHAGFLSSLGFLSTWPTNEDNSSRVTVNQALIVALGRSFDGVAVTDFSPEGLSAEHAEPGSECYGCHQTLDPMRDFFRGSRSNHYGDQLDESLRGKSTDFVFGGVQAQGAGLRDLASLLANHPAVASAWTQKLCTFANAAPCPEGPELDRVVGAFVASDLDVRVLVTELFASPLVSGARCLDDLDAGTTATIARRSTFCRALSTRTGIEDVCGHRSPSVEASPLQRAVRLAVGSVPDDAFSRGVIEPIAIADTSLFTRANVEAACGELAERGLDTIFPHLDRGKVVEELVTRIMGLPEGDPRRAEALAIVDEHLEKATAEGARERDALASALAMACMAPTLTGVGF